MQCHGGGPTLAPAAYRSRKVTDENGAGTLTKRGQAPLKAFGQYRGVGHGAESDFLQPRMPLSLRYQRRPYGNIDDLFTIDRCLGIDNVIFELSDSS